MPQAHIFEEIVYVTTAGVAGSATGSSTSHELDGYLESIYFDFHASCPATADTTVAFATRGGNIIVLTNTATDVLHAPVKQACDATGTAIPGAYVNHVLNQPLTVSVAQADALTNCVTVYIRYVKT